MLLTTQDTEWLGREMLFYQKLEVGKFSITSIRYVVYIFVKIIVSVKFSYLKKTILVTTRDMRRLCRGIYNCAESMSEDFHYSNYIYGTHVI
jgi:hypothetical protein